MRRKKGGGRGKREDRENKRGREREKRESMHRKVETGGKQSPRSQNISEY